MIIAEVGVVPAKKLGGEFEYTNNWSWMRKYNFGKFIIFFNIVLKC